MTRDDVVQDTAGLRLYLKDTRLFGANIVRWTGKRNTIAAVYDLPAQVSLSDAVGGYVTQGTVQGRLPAESPENQTPSTECST